MTRADYYKSFHFRKKIRNLIFFIPCHVMAQKIKINNGKNEKIKDSRENINATERKFNSGQY